MGIRENIDGKNLKRIYCPYEIYFPNLILNNCEKLEKVFIFKGDAETYHTCYSPYVSIKKYDLANVLYYYNYLEDEAEDCYWIDDYNYGATIKYIPQDPVRDGYIFDGWYKEKECLNKWNFETDKLPDAVTESECLGNSVNVNEMVFDERYLYQPTKIYAKWIKI